MEPANPQNPPKNSWDEDFESMSQSQDPEGKESQYISDPEINRPLHKSPFLKFPVILLASLTVILGVAYLFFGGMLMSKEEITAQKTDDKVSTLGISDQERLANAEAKSAMGGTDKAFASHLQSVGDAPSSTKSPATSPVKVKPSPPVVAKRQRPQTQARIVYRTITPKPAPIKPIPVKPIPVKPISVKRPLGKPMPTPPSFISLGKGQQTPRQAKQSTPKREPLASEKNSIDILDRIAPAATSGADPLKAGQNTSVHLMSTLQFNDRGDTPLQVMLDRPLVTLGTKQIPAGSIILFQASVNPQNGAITAVSGDAVVNGKTVRIQKGAMSLEITDRRGTARSPLVAQSVNLKEGELATADRNNALVGIGGAIGKELTKGTASVTVGNGSTIIQQGNNPPNLFGAALGSLDSVVSEQRQRVQTKAAQALAAPPIQSLPVDTPLLLTVNFPAPIDR